VRSGDLDFLLLKPIDEQFLVTCRSIDWSTLPNVLVGGAVMVVSLWRMGWAFDALRLGLFFIMFLVRLALADGFLGLLAAACVWLPGSADCGVGVAGAQPEPVRVVVAVQQPDALPARDLPGADRSSGGLVLQLRGAGDAGHQRAGRCDGAGARSALRGVHRGGD